MGRARRRDWRGQPRLERKREIIVRIDKYKKTQKSKVEKVKIKQIDSKNGRAAEEGSLPLRKKKGEKRSHV